nr:MAG TPA: hypothetical protein [Caudoviricetes sp.]
MLELVVKYSKPAGIAPDAVICLAKTKTRRRSSLLVRLNQSLPGRG